MTNSLKPVSEQELDSVQDELNKDMVEPVLIIGLTNEAKLALLTSRKESLEQVITILDKVNKEAVEACLNVLGCNATAHYLKHSLNDTLSEITVFEELTQSVKSISCT